MKTLSELIEKILELEQSTRLACESTALSLEDSPISRGKQIFNHIGFYQGFCAANNWPQNLDFVNEMIDLAK